MNLRAEIKKAIKTTLVIENKQSIDITVNKIMDVLEKSAKHENLIAEIKNMPHVKWVEDHNRNL